MKNFGKWFYLLGLLVAVVAGLLSFSATWLSLILVLLGILAAIFYVDHEDVVNFGIRFLLLAAVYAVFDAIPGIGTFFTSIFGAVLAFLGPVALTTLVVYFVKKHLLGKK